MSVRWRGSHPSIPQVNTPFDKPRQNERAEVEVTDPRHPLYGRSYAIQKVQGREQAGQYVFVKYGEHAVLRIEIEATNLVAAEPRLSSKLSLSAIKALVDLVQQEERTCVAQESANPQQSGHDCQTSARKPLSTNSRRSLSRS